MQQALGFRSALRHDIAVLLELVHSAYRGDASRAGWTTEADLLDGQRTDREELEALIGDPRSRLLLALSSRAGTPSGIAGCVLVQLEDTGAAHIGLFAVRPTLQARGFGSALLREAERVARHDFGCTRARMTVIEQRSDILAWYARRGYTATGEREPFPYGDPRFGLPRRSDLRFLVLEKELEAAGARHSGVT